MVERRRCRHRQPPAASPQWSSRTPRSSRRHSAYQALARSRDGCTRSMRTRKCWVRSGPNGARLPLQHRQKDAPAARTAAASAAPHRHRIASTVAGARTQLSQQPQLPVSALATLVPHASPCGARYAFIHEERGLLIISKKPDKTKPFWHKDHTCATGPPSPPECPPGPSISRAA